MWWQYALVFFGAIIVDITPLPLPPAFTLMIFLQTVFGLSIWPVIILGVAGSAVGRLILTYYIPAVANHILNTEKNEDIRLLGEKIKTKGFKAQLFMLVYTLLPLSSTPLFIAGGVARVSPLYMLPAFILGKCTTDSVAVFMGKYAAENTDIFLTGKISTESVVALLLFLLLMFFLLFINWRSLIHDHKIQFKFNIWKRSGC
jgi:membrane protein YqaA with SNARE-associated domain